MFLIIFHLNPASQSWSKACSRKVWLRKYLIMDNIFTHSTELVYLRKLLSAENWLPKKFWWERAIVAPRGKSKRDRGSIGFPDQMFPNMLKLELWGNLKIKAERRFSIRKCLASPLKLPPENKIVWLVLCKKSLLYKTRFFFLNANAFVQ